MKGIKQKIEDIICECDPDSIIPEEMLDEMVSKLAECFTDDDDEDEDPYMDQLYEMNKNLAEIALCFHEQVWGK